MPNGDMKYIIKVTLQRKKIGPTGVDVLLPTHPNAKLNLIYTQSALGYPL
jgi:hypothetical protein